MEQHTDTGWESWLDEDAEFQTWLDRKELETRAAQVAS